MLGQEGREHMSDFAGQLWREARRRYPHDVLSVILLLRPRASPSMVNFALAPVALAVRHYIRQCDVVLLDSHVGIAVVLADTSATRARSAARRICHALGEDASLRVAIEYAGSTAVQRVRIGVGYCSFSTVRPLSRWHVANAMRSAARSQATFVVDCPPLGSANQYQYEEEPQLIHRPQSRAVERTGRRTDERAVVMRHSSANQRPAGATTTTTKVIDELDELADERGRVVRFAPVIRPAHDRLRLRALSMGVPYLHLPPVVPEACRSALPGALARELRVVPIGRTERALTVAMDARWSAQVLFRLRHSTGLEIFPVLTLTEELDRALRQLAE